MNCPIGWRSSARIWSMNVILQMCHSLSLVYQRVPLQRPHLLLHHLQHRIPFLMTTDTPKIQYQTEVEVRVESFTQTRCMKRQKPKTRIKIGNRKKYEETYRMNCLIVYKNSGNIWFMNVLRQSYGETLSLDIETLPVLLMNYQWSREQAEPAWWKHSVCTHFPKDPNCDICLKTKITRASCRRRAQSGKFWWLDNSRSQKS